MGSLHQEVIVDPTMLVVMSDGRPVGRHVLGLAQGSALQHAPMMHQHVSHLEYRCRMYAASRADTLLLLLRR